MVVFKKKAHISLNGIFAFFGQKPPYCYVHHPYCYTVRENACISSFENDRLRRQPATGSVVHTRSMQKGLRQRWIASPAIMASGSECMYCIGVVLYDIRLLLWIFDPLPSSIYLDKRDLTVNFT